MRQVLILILLVSSSVVFAGNKIPKKLRQTYSGYIPEYSVNINETIVIIDKTTLQVELKETHALVTFGNVTYNLKIEELEKVKKDYIFKITFPEDTKLGKLKFSLNKKSKVLQFDGPGVVPDGELR